MSTTIFTQWDYHVLTKACEAITDNPSNGRYTHEEIERAGQLQSLLGKLAGNNIN